MLLIVDYARYLTNFIYSLVVILESCHHALWRLEVILVNRIVTIILSINCLTIHVISASILSTS